MLLYYLSKILSESLLSLYPIFIKNSITNKFTISNSNIDLYMYFSIFCSIQIY